MPDAIIGALGGVLVATVGAILTGVARSHRQLKHALDVHTALPADQQETWWAEIVVPALERARRAHALWTTGRRWGWAPLAAFGVLLGATANVMRDAIASWHTDYYDLRDGPLPTELTASEREQLLAFYRRELDAWASWATLAEVICLLVLGVTLLWAKRSIQDWWKRRNSRDR